MQTETIDRLYLELSQFTEARTAREIKMCEVISLLNSMVESGERHSETSRQMVKDAIK